MKWLWALALLFLLNGGCALQYAYQTLWVERCRSLQALTDDPEIRVVSIPHVAQKKGWDCGPAVLSAVISYLAPDAPEDPEAIISAIGVRRNGYSLRELRDFARSKRYRAFVLRLDPGDLFTHLREGRPIIVLLKQRFPIWKTHFVVVIGYDVHGNIVVQNPSYGYHVYIGSHFYRKWNRTSRAALLVLR